MFKIRKFTDKDSECVIKLWNECLTRNPMDIVTFQKKVLLDVNFDKELCLVAEKEGKVKGFAYGMSRKYPYEERGMEFERGWIAILFMQQSHRNKGVGKAMVQALEAKLLALGKKEITLAATVPTIFSRS